MPKCARSWPARTFMKAAVSALADCLLAQAQPARISNIRQITSDRNAKERYEFNIVVAAWQ